MSTEQAYVVTDDPPHDCTEVFPSPDMFAPGTVIRCNRFVLRNAATVRCQRRWIAWPGTFWNPKMTWKEETYDW